MREVLASNTLGDIAASVAAKAPADFSQEIAKWLANKSPISRGADKTSLR
jgi:hypothetical protein